MELDQLVNDSILDTRASLWPAFAPEVMLCATILVILLVRMFRWGSTFHTFFLTLVGALVALYYAYPTQYVGFGPETVRYELFTGMLVYDTFAVYVRALLIFFTVLFAIFTRLSGIPDREDSADFYSLVLGATVGMCLMASANHLLIVFLAVEMASVPSYALVAMLKGRRESSEAALKYAVYGAGAAGVMLYGISLLTGIAGSAHLPTIATTLASELPTMGAGEKMVLVLAALMIMVGLAFKLSAVPFHFWCPDVFEGASAEVNAFLSVASKAAALALLVRVTIGLGVVPTTAAGPPPVAQPVTSVQTAQAVSPGGAVFAVEHENTPRTESTISGAEDGLSGVRQFMAMVVAFVAVITCTFGNLAAYGQANIKRLLAYSTIAHAGYMLLAIPAALALYGFDNVAASEAISALALYMAIYVFMNLGAFAIVAFLRNELGSEQIEDYAGLVHKSPTIVICMGLVMFSLVGIPPLAGFVGKFAIFASLVDGYRITGHTYLIVLLVLGGLNTVISLFYYLRVVKVMTMDPESEHVGQWGWSMISLGGAFVMAVTLPLIVLFFPLG